MAKHKIQICDQLYANPCCGKGYIDLMFIVLLTRLQSLKQIIDKTFCYMQLVVNSEKDWLFPSTVVLSFNVAAY